MSYLHVLVPSRGRPHTLTELTEAFRATCRQEKAGHSTRLTFVVDADDPTLEDYRTAAGELSYVPVDAARPGWRALPTIPDLYVTEPGPTGTCGMVYPLNQAATEFAAVHPFAANRPQPTALMFMGDDHRPRTEGWDTLFLAALETSAIVYGNDLLQGANLPTAAAIRVEVIRALGWMAPPGLKHLYVDDAWKNLGHTSNSIRYLPEVVVEHLHPANGKGKWDDGYGRVNAADMYEHDRNAFQRWVAEDLVAAVDRVRQVWPS